MAVEKSLLEDVQTNDGADQMRSEIPTLATSYIHYVYHVNTSGITIYNFYSLDSLNF